MISDVLPVGTDSSPTITPTDISQYIRLDQCQRYLRLQLHTRNGGSNFWTTHNIQPQPIAPLLSEAGAGFEQEIEAGFSAEYQYSDLGADTSARQRIPDNERVVEEIRSLPTGAIKLLLQPRLSLPIGDWQVRGDLDILRLERDGQGHLHILIVDMKRSASAKNEHRLQLAFYQKMTATLLDKAGIDVAAIGTGVLYRGVEDDQVESLSEDEKAQRELHLQATQQYFHGSPGLLDITDDPEAFLAEVEALVLAPNSRAAGIAAQPFAEIPFHLAMKCDGCFFNEFCMKWSAEYDDLSLLPHLSVAEKNGLLHCGVSTMQQLANLKSLPALPKAEDTTTGKAGANQLSTPPGNEAAVRALSATWPVGPRLDELIHRARRYRRFKGDDISYKSRIPSKGYGSLPYCDADHNPNLVRIYIDAQHDYLHDRLYLLGALVVASENGDIVRRRSVVHLLDSAPDSADKEAELLTGWVSELLEAVSSIAAPDAEGELKAPIHLIFWNSLEQSRLLEALGRHSTAVFATPLYDFVTQIAAYDSPVVSFLDQEIRELKNYPMLCQTLQDVARYLRFDWNGPQPFRSTFYARLFDAWRAPDVKPEDEQPTPEDPKAKPRWYTSRARFSSMIPLEYGHSAWGLLPPPNKKGHDQFRSYRLATYDNLQAFQARRLEAMEHVAGDFAGNKQTVKTAFALPDLANFECKARDLASALEEFVTIERHVELGAWKSARLAPPERRVLAGETLIVRYLEADQSKEVRDQNRENQRRYQLQKAWYEANPDGKPPKQEKEAFRWKQEDLRFRLRLECTGLDCDLDQMIGLTGLRDGAGILLLPRWSVDTRLPVAEQQPFTPTPKQMLYGLRASIVGMPVDRDSKGNAKRAWVEVEISGSRHPGKDAPAGFVFPTMGDRNVPLLPGELYTIDSDPNDWYGAFCARVVRDLAQGCDHTLYQRFCDPTAATAHWPAKARRAQKRFLDGLDALGKKDKDYLFEPSKREYISQHGDAPLLLVQGPPGTGKSYATAFALWARMQGALAADLEWRVFCGCKTHAATDVLLQNIRDVQQRLKTVRRKHPDIFKEYFDPRLLDIPLYRAAKTETIEGVIPLPKKGDQQKGDQLAALVVGEQPHCFVGTTPGGVYRLLKDAGELFGQTLCGCMVLDEASQMNLPEAIMASLALCPEGQVIVVGDHRQMPPIIKHNWEIEPRRTFSEFKSYASLFEALLELGPPMIRFEESFRLHADMAAFLHQEIYRHDGIHYHSNKHKTLPSLAHSDPFVQQVLLPQYPIVVVVHNEAQSLLHNAFERDLLRPVLEALAAADGLHLDAQHGLGVVVPHRAQRASLQDAVPLLRVLDPETGEIVGSAVDTVERFQGGERDTIVVSATESDPQYLLVSGEFLLDPRRLTVALSRAKKKMILIASRSVFDVFSSDEEVFQNSQIWKNLLRRTCTVPLWQGDRNGYAVEVWGNNGIATASALPTVSVM